MVFSYYTPGGGKMQEGIFTFPKPAAPIIIRQGFLRDEVKRHTFGIHSFLFEQRKQSKEKLFIGFGFGPEERTAPFAGLE